MKNFIFIILLVVFGFANENNRDSDNLENEFEDEFSQKKEEIFDPLSGYNRLMTSFNDKVFINILNPTSEGYANIVHENIRIGKSGVYLHSFFVSY